MYFDGLTIIKHKQTQMGLCLQQAPYCTLCFNY